MAVSDRKLEENEAKIDNILHKVIKATTQIRDMCGQVNEQSSGTFLMERIKRIELLSDIINNLACFADEIEIADERLTVDLEDKIHSELDKAISYLKEAKNLLGEPRKASEPSN
ncbi:MAG: hypothetical protein ABIG95_06065 [Candidatus Woesearchaeota archaeon]